MSGLIKSAKKAVKKAFKFVRKVVKKITSSKIFKAVALAAMVYFTAGATAGFLSNTAAGAGAATTTNAASAAIASAEAGVAAASTAGASTSIASTIASTLGKGIQTVGTLAKAHPAVTSSLLTTGGSLIAQQQAAKAEQDAYERDKADLLEANQTELPVAERLKATSDRILSQGRFRNNTQQKRSSSFYDPHSDTYKAVG